LVGIIAKKQQNPTFYSTRIDVNGFFVTSEPTKYRLPRHMRNESQSHRN